MKRIATTCTLCLLMPSVALAGDPFTNYNEFFQTERVDENQLLLCMEELGIAEDANPVAAQLYLLRRCINRNKMSAKPLRRPQFTDRTREQYGRISTRARELGATEQKIRVRQLTKRNTTQKIVYRKTRASAIRNTLRSQRSSRRAIVRAAEKARSEAALELERRKRESEKACAGVPQSEKRDCIMQQLHNLNLSNN